MLKHSHMYSYIHIGKFHLLMLTCIHLHPPPPQHTHLLPASPLAPQWAGPAGGDLPQLGGFPGCLINYPSPIVYQEAGAERGEKAQNGHCQVEGSISLPAWGWGLGREWGRESEKDQSREVCLERREEHEFPGSWGWCDIIPQVRLWQRLTFVMLTSSG